MNEIRKHNAMVLERELDRLADGELSPDEMRRLLVSLDQFPDGWRRCALTFVEAQTWKAEMQALQPAAPVAAPRHALPPRQPRVPPQLTVFLAMAATFLLAFGLGSRLPRWPAISPAPATSLAGNDGVPAEAGPAMDDGVEGWLPLVVREPRGGHQQEFNVPVVDWNQGGAQLIAETSSIPDDVTRALRQRGRRVQREQGVWPVQLQDGRRVMVPLEQVQIVPISSNSYQ